MGKGSNPLTSTLFEEFLPKELSKSQRRRLELIEAAIGLFAEKGIVDVTYADVAKRAKASRALVQHYFPEWDELVLTTMKYIRARFQKLAVDLFQKESAPLAMLDAYVSCVHAWVERHPNDTRVWLLFYYYCSFKPDYLAIHTELTAQGQARIESLLELGVKSGDFRVKDARAAAKQIQGAMTGALVEMLSEHSRSIEEVSAGAIRVCRAIARGGADE